MDNKLTPQDIIDSYKRRQRMVPFLFIFLAVVLVILGVIIIIIAGKGVSQREPTSTPTLEPTAMQPTSTIAETPTITETPTETTTTTPNAPYEYVVQEGDNCYTLAEEHGVELEVLLAINNFTGCPIQPGQTILIPNPGMELPTPTPIPSDMPPGTRITYTVRLGDNLYIIASKFNSTVDKIMSLNKITDPNSINVGDALIIPVNIVTPTKTLVPTSTPNTPQPTATITNTP
jgi:LysM repeat protein